MVSPQQDVRMWLQELGFMINKPDQYITSYDEIFHFYDQICMDRSELDYEIDGIVFKVKRLAFTK